MNKTQEELKTIIQEAIQNFDLYIKGLTPTDAEFIVLVLDRMGYEAKIETDQNQKLVFFSVKR